MVILVKTLLTKLLHGCIFVLMYTKTQVIMIAQRDYKVPAGLTSRKRSEKISTVPLELVRACQLKNILIPHNHNY